MVLTSVPCPRASSSVLDAGLLNRAACLTRAIDGLDESGPLWARFSLGACRSYEVARPEPSPIRDRLRRPSATAVSSKSATPNASNAPMPASPQSNPDCELTRC